MDVPAAPGALSVADNFHARRRFLATDPGSVCFLILCDVGGRLSWLESRPRMI